MTQRRILRRGRKIQIAVVIGLLLTMLSFNIPAQLSAAEPTISITPDTVSCADSLVVEGEGFSPGSQVVISNGTADDIPEAVFDPYWGPVTVADDGSFVIEGIRPTLSECIGLSPEVHFLTASTATGFSPEDSFGPPTATAAFTVSPELDDPRMALSPDHGSGCLEVTAQGENFEPGTIVTLLANEFPGNHTVNYLGEADVAGDGSFSFSLPPQVTPFIACDNRPLSRDGQRYLVWASTGQSKVGDGLREPSAAHVFTVMLTAAEYFQAVWARTDLPVAEGVVSRTWMWGPTISDVMTEPYAESPDGTREVQYFDKSRMEITNPDEDPDSIWYVTNGLLVIEMISGEMQIGDDEFVPRFPSEIPVAGDQVPGNGPSYATFQALLEPVEDRSNSPIADLLDWEGAVTSDPALEARAVQAVYYDDVTGHNIASPFWAFINSSGTIWENGAFVDGLLFPNPFYATGRPITEPYWADVTVAGTDRLVLLQCFERRCLTYTPDNPEGWQVEAGNVGQHYYQWRYGDRTEPGQIIFEDAYFSTEVQRLVRDIYLINADGTGERNLTNNPFGDDRFPAWSPDGTEFAFFREDESRFNDTDDVYVMNVNDDIPELVAESVTVGGAPAWSPDGNYLALARDSHLVILDLRDRTERIIDTLPGLVIGSPSWSPNGDRLAFYFVSGDQVGSPPPQPFTISLVNADGSELTELTDATGVPLGQIHPTWSPDGKHLAFQSTNSFVDGQANEQTVTTLHMIEIDSRETWTAGAVSSAWSPGSTEIAYWVPNDGIYVADADGANRRRVSELDGELDWSPDGNSLAISGMYVVSLSEKESRQIRPGGLNPHWRPLASQMLLFNQGGDLFSVDNNGSNLQNLTDDLDLFASDAEWSPDGTHIAFVGSTDMHQAGPGVLFVMNADGTERTQITEGPYDSAPSWSPDGARIAFARLLPDMYGPIGSFTSESKIFIVDADGSNERQITDIPPEEIFSVSQSPDWSPDGQWIAFSNVNGIPGPAPRDSTLYLVRPDGSDLTVLAETAGDSQPIWSPTSDAIVNEKQPGGSNDFEGSLLRYISLESREPILIAGGERADPDDPAWSPTGDAVVFWRHAERYAEETELVRYDLATSETRVIAHFGIQTAWSADGESLAVVADGGIVVINTDGTDPVLIHYGGSSPQWQPVS